MAEATREQRLRELFERAVGLPPADRTALIASLDDELLAERLRALLAQDAMGTAAVLQQSPADTLQPLRRLGHYELLRELGHGGMGTVLLARQIEPVERLVALKIADARPDLPSAIARFEQERQTLALLDHPGIARLYEAGTHAGTPYFAMEYVRGEPITDYCDRRRLDLDRRVLLFAEVCAAVQHAHQQAVLHRDLKPHNVLVTEAGGETRPKVIDFGVAQALARAPGQGALADDGAVVGTWHYMSPEQAEPRGQAADTRTDIYSLGALLHELLVGAVPHAATTWREGEERTAAFARFRTVLRAQSLPHASVGLQALPAAQQQVHAGRRATTAPGLHRQLQGDLDAILAQALATDRNDRYASASELRADLLRRQRHEPVLAVPSTAHYRLRKFVRRHRTAVIAASLLLLSLLGTAVGTTFGLVEASRAQSVETAAKNAARRQLARVAAQADFFDLVVVHADPGTGLPPPSLREVLLRLEPRIAARYSARPHEEAAVRAAVGRVYLSAGEPHKAEAQLRHAWRLTDAEAEPIQAFVLLHHLVRATRKARGLPAARALEITMLELGVRALAHTAPEWSRAFTELASLLPLSDQHEVFQRRFNRLVDEVTGRPAGDAGVRVAAPLLGLLLMLLLEDGQPIGHLSSRLEPAVRAAMDDDVELQHLLVRHAEYRLRAGAFDDARRMANEVVATLDQLGFFDHWLLLQAQRVRGLALALGGAEAEGETALVELHERLQLLPDSANEQARLAAGCLVELSERLHASGAFAAFCRASLTRWTERASKDASLMPWWPATIDGIAEPARRDALAVVTTRRASDAGNAALRLAHGAMLVRLGKMTEALVELEPLWQRGTPTPELLADVVCAYREVGRRSDAEAALADLTAIENAEMSTRIAVARRRAPASIAR